MPDFWKRAAIIVPTFAGIVTIIYHVPDIYDRVDRFLSNINEERYEYEGAITETPTVKQPQSEEDNCISTPPLGLVHLREESDALLWSTGVWGSKNLLTFTIALAEIDTDHPAFGEFRIWLDPCKIDAVGGNHGYVDGARFQPAVGSKWASHSSPPLIIGQEAVIRISPNTGIWGLGNHP